MERRCSARIPGREKKKKKLGAETRKNSGVDRLCFVFELGPASVLDYLAADDISNCLQVCVGGLSEAFVAMVSLKALDQFAVENETHIGHNCPCDWMQNLDFIYRGGECSSDVPFGVHKSLALLQSPGGARQLLNALVLTKRILLPYCIDSRRGEDMFAPVVCVITEESTILDNKEDLTKALNSVCKGFGKRFFSDSTAKRAYKKPDFIDEHWDSIEGSDCEYCYNLEDLHYKNPSRAKWKTRSVKRIRANCTEVYRPLKAAMEKELRFARFICRPKYGQRGETKYQGLLAGISPGGVLCGLYLVNGYWSYTMRRQTRSD